MGMCGMLFSVTFTDIDSGLQGVEYSSVDWGDYDNDGDLDVILCGQEYPLSPVLVHAKIYENDNGIFTDIQAGLPGISGGSVAWGDYDNDGDLDVLLSGKIFRNDGDDVFTDINAGLPFQYGRASVKWVDYDNDGDLDVFINGESSTSGLISEIYENNNGTFSDINAGITPTHYGSSSWGDYDNDGDLDILITGHDSSSIPLTELWQNNSGSFSCLNVGLIDLYSSSVDWGDYDSDGDLDILITGYSGSTRYSKIYRNDANNTFTDLTMNLPGFTYGSADWGDFDNDGDFDILLTGYSGTPTTKIYENVDGSFSSLNVIATLMGVHQGAAACGDYDNDGDIDVIITGMKWTDGTNEFTEIYRNDSETANTIPDAPSNLTYTLSGQDVTLSWDQADDNETPADGLSYNIYVGTTSGGCDIVSPMSNTADGLRNIVSLGNVNQNTSWTIKDLPDGTYYWSVQSVDHAFAGSDFATEQTFTVSDFTEIDAGLSGVNWSSTAWGDYDNDGDLDLLVTGRGSTTYLSKIYRNDSGVLTEDIYADEYLTGVGYSSVAWGDYDNDDDLDILITGYVNSTTRISNIYSNDSGIFNNINAGLTPVSSSSVAWGDYDNDGDLDILLSGYTGTAACSKIYENDGGTFTDISAGLQNVYYSSVAWGDYDNDGDLDILLTGYTGSGRVSNIYRNDDGTFTDISAGLTGVYSSSVAWGDYDSDGDLDILLTGYLISKVYNNNSGVFTDISAGLTGVTYSSSAWGDYDNDGKLDILLSGYVNSTTNISKIYRNTGTSFTDISAELTGVQNGSLGWSDFDNDGDIDVLLTGNIEDTNYIAEMYRNNSAVANTIPDYPLNPSSIVNGDEVILSWDKATDNETPQDGLSYNLYLADTGFIVNPMSDISTGFRRIVSIGNTSQNTSYVIKGLEHGTYYWGVQAIDHSFAGSEYPSTDQVFVIEDFTDISDNMVNIKQGSNSWGDYDGDGDLDILMTGYSGSAPVSKVYENDGGSFTEDTNISLTGVYYSSVAWGDYDGDDDLDILLTGYTGSAAVSKVYENDGGTFTEDTNISLTGVYYSSVAWGDYDGDDDLDILLTGYTGSVSVSKIYENDGGTFTDISAGLTAVYESSVAWGDYDGDDDLDILLTGYTGSVSVSKIYENDGGTFTADTNISLTGVSKSSVAWGDYDNDNDIDILMMGYTGTATISIIYNNNNGAFTDINAGLTGLRLGMATWGDYDNDGCLDIAITGFTSSSVCTAKVYRNNSGTFSDISAGLTGVYYSTVAWGDYDNDSDLDLLLTGLSLNGWSHTIIYRNNSYVTLSKNGINVTDQEEDNDANSIPSGIDEMIPCETALYQNYPNPFNPVTQIKFDLAKSAKVRLSVYNVSGQKVAELVNGVMNAGNHTADFDGSKLNSGIYYYTLEAGGNTFTKKMVLTK
jgi:predicted nucleotidyltransferase